MKYFKDLSKEEKLEMIEAQLDGKTIEFWDGQGWLRTLSGGSLIYYSDVCYRVAKTKDEFTNWEILSPEYKWIARDSWGVVEAFTKKPKVFGQFWLEDGDEDEDGGIEPVNIKFLTCYKQGTVDWEDSLIERPE
jgi:hypothetical protein